MTTIEYLGDDIGKEIEAPAGYYQPVEDMIVECMGRKLLYVLGCACIETSCCGAGSWSYARVEGHVVDGEALQARSVDAPVRIETIEDDDEKAAIREFLQGEHPGIRIEFR